jgi:hypothetical protein
MKIIIILVEEWQSDTDTKSHGDEDTFYSQSNTGSVDLYLYRDTK